jgi:hypothetical protein
MPADLHAEVEKLRAWLSLAGNRWVDQYECWWSDGGVVSATRRFVNDVHPEDWSEQDVTDLLYVLEQSSTDYVVELVTESEAAALAIAKHSLARGGLASDDIAEQLGQCVQRREEAEALLLEFAQDKHERTRRLALLSLAKLRSSALPPLAISARNDGFEATDPKS